VSAQAAQKVHSNVQMRASALSGGRSRLQHSQLGFSLSITDSLELVPAAGLEPARPSRAEGF
jgi:hypothetical protein